MPKLPKEKYVEIFSSLPENVQDALLSLETADIIHEVGSKNKLNDASISILTGLVGDLLMGLVGEVDFQKRIEAEIALDSVSSNAITKELINRIVVPLKEESTKNVEPLKPVFIAEDKKESGKEVPPPPPPLPPPVTSQAPTPPSQVAPTFEAQHETPFILHKEEEIEPTREASPYSMKRPEFYKPTFSEEYKRSKQAESAAHIELGEEVKKVEPRMERTSAQSSRIVHYSQFKTPLDSPEGAIEKKKDVKSSEVHPNNVIDLKDLPLE